MNTKCAVCSVPATLKCTGCFNVIYCGKEHQKEDWKKGHKSVCKCYEIKNNDQLGRHVVATRNIKKGEIILKEMPLIFGPKLITPAVCLGCLKILRASADEDDFNRCSKCNWPICDFYCENSSIHEQECKTFCSTKYACPVKYSTTGRKESSYSVIIPMRIIQMLTKNKTSYDKIMSLQSHLNERRNTQLYQILSMNLVMFVKMLFKDENIDKETILNICGILDTNSFDIKLPTSKVIGRGIYYGAAMFAHSCLPNARHLFKENMQMVMFATDDIKKGEIISISYTQPLKCTNQRRKNLKEIKCFDCMCERCLDPTECNLYLNSINCTKCKDGKVISIDTKDINTDFKCENCNVEYHAIDVEETKQTLINAIRSANISTPLDFECLLKSSEYKKIMPITCSALLEVKYAVIQLYGDPKLLDTNGLNRKIELCKEMLEVADVLSPGLGALRSSILNDLYECLTVLFKESPEMKENAEFKKLYEQANYVKNYESSILV